MKPLIIAGPCAVEDREQIITIAKLVKECGVDMLRGGAYKPRTTADSFQGLGQEGLNLLEEAKAATGLPIVTEVVSPEHIVAVAKTADVIQIGARNMQNFELLKMIGERAPNTPVILKRGMSATKKELLGALTYLSKYGHKAEVYVCERGIRTFANGEYDRFTLDVNFIADLKADVEFKHKVIVDPSHPAGRADLVLPLALAGIAAGADGIIVEVKREGTTPLSDASQAITVDVLKELIAKSKEVYSVRSLT